MTKKKKKKESWKEKRRRLALKRQKALEAERLRREREPKKGKGWSKGKIFGVALMFLLIIGIYGTWQYTQSSVNNGSNVNKKEAAPLFTLTDIDGKVVSLADFTGKVVVLNFFDTKCTWCIPQISELVKVYAHYNTNDVIIISIDVYPPDVDTVPVLQQFREKHQINWTLAQDIWQDGPVTFGEYVTFLNIAKPGTPTTIILDQNSFISPHGPFIGLADASILLDEINSLLSR